MKPDVGPDTNSPLTRFVSLGAGVGAGVHSAHALSSSTCSTGPFFFVGRHSTSSAEGLRAAHARQPSTKRRLKALAGSRSLQEKTLLEVKSLHARMHEGLQRRGVGGTLMV